MQYPDLRNDYEARTSVSGGTLYRRATVVQVWWDVDAGGRLFDNSPEAVKRDRGHGRETWTHDTLKNATENFNCMSERWNEA